MTATSRLVRASLVTLTCLFVLAIQAMAESDSANYISGQLLTTFQSQATIEGQTHDIERGLGFAMAIGRKLSLFRVELEFAVSDLNQDSESFNGNTLAGTHLPSLVEGRRLSLLKPQDVVSVYLTSDEWLAIDRKEVDVYDFRMMVNGWYDVELMPRLSLFAGGGLGLTHTSLSATYVTTATFEVERLEGIDTSSGIVTSRIYSTIYNETVWGLGYQVGAGVSFDLFEKSQLTLSYRLTGTTRDNPSLQTHSVFLGLQYWL